MTDAERMQYDAWTRQLERMRGMQYAYNRKFFVLLLVSTLGVWFGFRDGLMVSLLAIPLGLITTGVTASFFLHQCDFARVHARALEGRINRLLGERVLIASELEAEYFYPHARPKLSGLPLGGRWTFFNGFTLHFCVVWTGASVLALWRVREWMSGGLWFLWLIAVGMWAAINVAGLTVWFASAAGERRMQQQLVEAYGDPADVHPR